MCFGLTAQVENAVEANEIADNTNADYIALTNGIRLKAKKIKIHTKWVKYLPDCEGCLTARFISPKQIDTIIYKQQDQKEYSKADESNRIAFDGHKLSQDTLHFLNNKNEKAFSLHTGQKVKFATSCNKFSGYVRAIDNDQIAFSKERKLKNVDSLTLLSTTDIVRYKIKKSNGARFGGSLLKTAGTFGIYLGVGAAITLLNDVPVVIIAGVTAGGFGLYYWGIRLSTRKIIIGNRWQLSENDI